MDLHETYDGILGLNFLAWYSLLADTNFLVHLLEAGGANLSASRLQKEGTSHSKLVSAPRLHHTGIHLTTLHATTAADSHSLTDMLCHLQVEFHDVFCDDLGDVWNFPTISKTKSGICFEINLKQGATPYHSVPYCVPKALLPCFHEMLLEHLNVTVYNTPVLLGPPWCSSFLKAMANSTWSAIFMPSTRSQSLTWAPWATSKISYIMHCEKGRYLLS